MYSSERGTMPFTVRALARWLRTHPPPDRKAVSQSPMDCIWPRVRHGAGLLDHAEGVIRAVPRTGSVGAIVNRSRASMSSIASRSSSKPSAASVLRTLSGAAVLWSSTPRSSGGVSSGRRC